MPGNRLRLSRVETALAVSRRIEDTTGWSVKKFLRTVRRYRTTRSRPATTSSPQPTRYPTTPTRSSKRSRPAAAH
jgi:hypothetical protein